MIECGNCGSENQFDGAIFCKHCGAELNARVAVKTEEAPGARNSEIDHKSTTMPPRRVETKDDLGIEAVSVVEDEVTSEVAGVDKETAKETGFDALLKRYEKDQDQKNDLASKTEEADGKGLSSQPGQIASPEARTTSLGIESASDFLMREQAEPLSDTAKIPVINQGSQKNKMSQQKSNREQKKSMVRETAIAKDPLGNPLPSRSAETISQQEKSKLIDSLSKSFTEPEKAVKVHKPEIERSAAVSVVNQEIQPLKPKVTTPETPVAKTIKPQAADAVKTPEQPAITANIVFVRGQKLTFPEKCSLAVGDTVTYNNQTYQIKKGNIDKKSWLLGAVLVVVMALIMIVQSMNSSTPIKATMFGVITNSESHAVLAGVTVSIPQLGLSTVTDEYGSFKFAGIQNGRYDVKAEGTLFEARFFPISITNNQSAMVYGSLNPLIAKSAVISPSLQQKVAEIPNNDEPSFGGLKLVSNVADANVVLNGKVIGTVTQTFKKVKVGSYVLEVKRDGYQDYKQAIKIDGGETTELTVNLLTVKSDTPTEYTANDFFEQAEALVSESKYTEAVGYYTLALAKDNSMVQAYLRRAEANVLAGKSLNARADYRSAADIYIHSSMFANAIDCYNKIIEISPNAIDGYQSRGWAKISSGDAEGGIKDLEKALSFNREDMESQFELGKALCITSNYKEAEKILKKIRKFGDESPEIYGYLALSLMGQGDDSEARKNYEAFTKRATSGQTARMSAESGWQRLTALAGN